MSPRLTKSESPAIEGREEAEAAMEALARATHSRDSLQAKLDLALTEVRAKFEPQLTIHAEEIAAGEDALADWAKNNRAEFGDAKSLEMMHGILSFRTGMPSLRLIGRTTWETVLENLALLRQLDYLRSRVEVNKEKLISDADKLGEKLEAIGVRVVQKETLQITVKKDEVS